MPSIAVDAGPLIALFDGGDSHHRDAVDFFRKSNASFVTNVAVLTEMAHLLSFSAAARRDALSWVATAFDIDMGTGADMARIIEVMGKYADLPADFADASLLAMCERRGIDGIATFDQDFDVYQLAKGGTLRNVFRTKETG